MNRLQQVVTGCNRSVFDRLQPVGDRIMTDSDQSYSVRSSYGTFTKYRDQLQLRSQRIQSENWTGPDPQTLKLSPNMTQMSLE